MIVAKTRTGESIQLAVGDIYQGWTLDSYKQNEFDLPAEAIKALGTHTLHFSKDGRKVSVSNSQSLAPIIFCFDLNEEMMTLCPDALVDFVMRDTEFEISE